MIQDIITAALGAAAVVAAALLTYVAARRGKDMDRVAAVEAKLDKVTITNQKLWRYCRELVDHIYTGAPPPPPPFPANLFDDE